MKVRLTVVALTLALAACGGGGQGFFFKFRLFQHPMGQAAQEFQLRAAAFVAASPKPGVI
jgi:hypothetical protein